MILCLYSVDKNERRHTFCWAILKLLFGKEDEKCKLFIRLVNMAFCEKRYGLLMGKIKQLSNTVEDLSVPIDVASKAEEDAMINFNNIQSALGQMMDWSNLIQSVDQSISDDQKYRNMDDRRTSLHTTTAPMNAAHARSRARVSGWPS